MSNTPPIDLTTPGTAVQIYRDDGPSGPCGQSMSTTCSHTALHVFRSEYEMRLFLEAHKFRNGKRHSLHYLVVGEGGTLGTSLTVHSGQDS